MEELSQRAVKQEYIIGEYGREKVLCSFSSEDDSLSKRAKIKIAYMDGVITKEEMKRKLAEEKKEFEPMSPKDEPGFYEEGYCQDCGKPINNANSEICPECLASKE